MTVHNLIGPFLVVLLVEFVVVILLMVVVTMLLVGLLVILGRVISVSMYVVEAGAVGVLLMVPAVLQLHLADRLLLGQIIAEILVV